MHTLATSYTALSSRDRARRHPPSLCPLARHGPAHDDGWGAMRAAKHAGLVGGEEKKRVGQASVGGRRGSGACRLDEES